MYLLGRSSVECMGLGLFEGSLISVRHLPPPTDMDWKKYLSPPPPFKNIIVTTHIILQKVNPSLKATYSSSLRNIRF